MTKEYTFTKHFLTPLLWQLIAFGLLALNIVSIILAILGIWWLLCIIPPATVIFSIILWRLAKRKKIQMNLPN